MHVFFCNVMVYRTGSWITVLNTTLDSNRQSYIYANEALNKVFETIFVLSETLVIWFWNHTALTLIRLIGLNLSLRGLIYDFD